MPSTKPQTPMTDAELVAWEATRNIEVELLESIGQMVKGQTAVVFSPVIEARKKSGMAQSEFAKLLGVSVRTLQGWEQGRREPTGAAKTLIFVALIHPEVLKDVAAWNANEERFALAASSPMLHES